MIQEDNRFIKCFALLDPAIHRNPPFANQWIATDSALYRFVEHSFTQLPWSLRAYHFFHDNIEAFIEKATIFRSIFS